MNYVVYFHVNKIRQEIFYVGIGSEKRAYSVYGRNAIWKEVVQEFEYSVIIIERCLTWNDAQEKEINYIKQIGRIDKGNGTLVNLTDGGEGFTGVQYQEAIRRNFKIKVDKYRKLKAIADLYTHKVRQIK